MTLFFVSEHKTIREVELLYSDKKCLFQELNEIFLTRVQRWTSICGILFRSK